MTPEKRIENQIRTAFIEAGGYINKIFASPNTNKGIPDLIGVMNGVYIALEIKRLHGGKPTPVQIRNLKEIADAGGLAFVTNDVNLIAKLKTKTKNYHPQQQKLNTHQIIINYWSPTGKPTPTIATKYWHQHDDQHTLQILMRLPK